MKSLLELPPELIINMEDKSMVVTPDLEDVLPQVAGYYDLANQAYGSTAPMQLAYLRELGAQQFSFRHRLGRVDCTYMPGEGSRLGVSFAAFSDVKPWSGGEEMFQYTHATDEPSMAAKLKAAPNTWSQTTRFAHRMEVLRAVLGKNMPGLSINSIIPSGSFSLPEHAQMAQGDYRGAAGIMDHAITKLQEQLHGGRSETQIDEVDIYGASLGASMAIGAAHGTEHEVRSLTLQEYLVALGGSFRLLGRFIGSDAIGEPSTLREGVDYEQVELIKEPWMREAIDRYGNEPTWIVRALGAALRVRNRGMTHPKHNRTLEHLQDLAFRDELPMLALLGENSGLSEGTAPYLRERGVDVITVRGVRGTQAPHLINEHTALSSIGMPLNIVRGDYDRLQDLDR